MTDDIATAPPPGGAGRILGVLAFLVGLIAFLMVAGAGPGTRMGLWTFRTGLGTLMKYGAYLGVAAIALGLIALLVARRGPRGSLLLAGLALLFGVAAWYFPWSFRQHARAVPPIHDITTDFTNPPELTYSKVMRDTSGGRLNAWQYEGDSIARQQRKAYPDLRPVMLAMTPDEGYRAAMRAAREMGWEITVNEPEQRRLEAVDETRWFGFKDDVSIRVLPASGVARVDIRSVSRVGRSDVGMNAARIRKYIARLREDNRGKLAETS